MSKWVMWTHFRHLRSKNFQWYKKLFNPLGLAFVIILWRFKNPSGLQLPKWKLLRSVKVHSFTLSFIPGLPSWTTTLQALALLASPRLGLWHQVCKKSCNRSIRGVVHYRVNKFSKFACLANLSSLAFILIHYNIFYVSFALDFVFFLTSFSTCSSTSVLPFLFIMVLVLDYGC
jgi:hypothetical protein